MSVHPSIPDLCVVEKITSPGPFFGRVVVPVPDQNIVPKKGKIGLEYIEHCFIGDAIKLTLTDDQTVAASGRKFKLPNGLELTYGQINALAGDFYGTRDPISDGETDEVRSDRFVAAYNTLANPSSRQPKEANAIIELLQAEVDAINNALEVGQDPSAAYSKLPNVDLKLEALTLGRRRDGLPDYVELASINWDHFGGDARKAYNAGHATAIRAAIGGDLEGAYAMNAFADHFLEDLFSSGHLRIPRRLLHKPPSLASDWCAKLMHDEDCAIGLQVSNPSGESWKCYGNKQALDEGNAENLRRCVAAVQASADEIYTAYSTKQAPSASTYAAWRHAPTLESARSPSQELTELFTFDLKRRRDITERRVREFTDKWQYFTTSVACEASGHWHYPITINGVHIVIPWSSISVVSPSLRSVRLFYQTPGGAILQSVRSGDKWIHVHDKPIVSAVPFTPLASVDWKDGKEVRVYYLDPEYVLQEYCYSEGRGWFAGGIGKMNIRTSTNTRISAVQYGDDEGGVHIHVYYQEEARSRAIGELCNDGGWHKGSLYLPGALDGTSIAATTYNLDDQTQIHIYYQDEDLSLREHCHNGEEWSRGEWNPGRVQGGNPITAVAYASGDDSAQIQVYWRNLQEEIVFSKFAGGWGATTKVVGGIGSCLWLALLQWEKGTFLRLYHQNRAGVVVEHCSDNGGKTWVPGWQVGGVLYSQLDHGNLIWEVSK